MKWNLKHDGVRAASRRLENDCLRRRTAALLVWFLCCPVVVLLMIPVFAEDFARDEGGFKAGASALLAGVIYLTVSVNFKTGIGDAWARVAGTLPVSQRDRMRLVRRLALLPVVMWTFTSILAALFFVWKREPDPQDFIFIGSAIPLGLAAFAAAGLHHAARQCGGRSGTLEIAAFLTALAAGALTPHEALRLLIPAALCVLIAILVWRRMEYLDILPWWRDEFPPDNTTASQASKPEALRKPENVALVTGLWLLRRWLFIGMGPGVVFAVIIAIQLHDQPDPFRSWKMLFLVLGAGAGMEAGFTSLNAARLLRILPLSLQKAATILTGMGAALALLTSAGMLLPVWVVLGFKTTLTPALVIAMSCLVLQVCMAVRVWRYFPEPDVPLLLLTLLAAVPLAFTFLDRLTLPLALGILAATAVFCWFWLRRLLLLPSLYRSFQSAI